MKIWTMRTLSESVTDHSEIGRTEIGGNQEERENVGKSRVSAIAVILRSPERKAEIKEPIKESIRDRLARSQKRADELNARRRAERGMAPRRKQQDMDL